MKVTVGLESHWLCVTDFSGLSTPHTGSTATETEMSTPPIRFVLGNGPLYLTYLFIHFRYVTYFYLFKPTANSHSELLNYYLDSLMCKLLILSKLCFGVCC